MYTNENKEWFYMQNNQQRGPIPFVQLRELAQRGQLNPQADQVWCQGMPAWASAGQVQGLFPQGASSPPRPIQAPPQPSGYGAPQYQAVTSQSRAVKRASFGMLMTLFGVYFGAFILGIILVFVGESQREDAISIIGGIFMFIGMIAMIWGVVLAYIYIYRMWTMIQDGYARTTPGKAVGFMFIPFFSLYWVFVAYHGWSLDYNQFIQRNGRQHAPMVSEGLFLAFAILTACLIIPLLNYLAMLGLMVVALMCFHQICRAINFFVDYP